MIFHHTLGPKDYIGPFAKGRSDFVDLVMSGENDEVTFALPCDEIDDHARNQLKEELVRMRGIDHVFYYSTLAYGGRAYMMLDRASHSWFYDATIKSESNTDIAKYLDYILLPTNPAIHWYKI